MRSLHGFILATALATVACGGNSMMPSAMSSMPAGSTSGTAISGTWGGSMSDSSGTMMGAGMSASMMGNMSWQITQTGNEFTGTMQFPGHGGSGMVTGTINGRTATFTMTMPTGSMMTATCTATGTGTFDMDNFMTQMHGTYSGSNTCTGAFHNGQMSMNRR